MTTTTRPDAVLAPADNDVPSSAQPTPEKMPDRSPEKKRHWVVPVVVGTVAFGAGVAVGCNLTWRFSIWWKPS